MSWPGQLREVENVVRRALVSSHGIISLGDVQEAISQDTVAKSAAPLPVEMVEGLGPGVVQDAVAKSAAQLPAGDQPLAAYVSDLLAKVMRGEGEDAQARVTAAAERELYSQAIHLAGGNQSQAARWLGV